MNKKINLLIMPTDICNMNCVYCFHEAHHENSGKMELRDLRRLYDITFKAYSDVTIIWHGGEPLVMGLDFYKEALAMQKEYSATVRNRMQSNLTLLTDELAKFLCENNVGIGTSFDGVANSSTRGHTEEILKGRERILKYHKSCGFIMVISRKNIDHLIESYQFFKSLSASFTMNPYVSTGFPEDSSLRLNPSHAVMRLKEFFDYWLHDVTCCIHIDYFERIINFLICGEKTVCKYNSCLGKWAGIRYNGEITPCNRYFPKQYSYGNIWDYDCLSSAFESPGFQNLLVDAIARREKCKSCIAFPLCSGGCNNVALNENGVSENGGDSCLIFQEIYQYVVESTIFHAKKIRNGTSTDLYNPIFVSLLHRKRKSNADFHYDVYHSPTTL